MQRRGHQVDGEQVRLLRSRTGMTQEALAAKIGCDPRTIRNAEKNKRIELKNISLIAAALGVRREELLVADVPTQQRNIQTVEAWIEAWNQADIDLLLSFHHPETILELPGAGDMPNIPKCETFVGLEALRQHFEYVFSEFRWVRENPGRQFDAVGDLVFHRTEAVFRGLATEREAVTRFYNEFEIVDDLIVRRMTISELSGHRHVLGIE